MARAFAKGKPARLTACLFPWWNWNLWGYFLKLTPKPSWRKPRIRPAVRERYHLPVAEFDWETMEEVIGEDVAPDVAAVSILEARDHRERVFRAAGVRPTWDETLARPGEWT